MRSNRHPTVFALRSCFDDSVTRLQESTSHIVEKSNKEGLNTITKNNENEKRE